MITQLMRLRSNSWRRLKLRRTQAKTKWDWPAEVDKGILDAKLFYLGTSLPNILDSSQSKSFMQFIQEVEVLKILNRISKHGLLLQKISNYWNTWGDFSTLLLHYFYFLFPCVTNGKDFAQRHLWPLWEIDNHVVTVNLVKGS